MRVRILPYKAGSRSARALAREMGVMRLNVQRSTFRPRLSDVIINWGCGDSQLRGARFFNHPVGVSIAQCKLATLIRLREAGVPHPEFTADPEVAEEWLAEGAPVVARTLLRASQARGLVLVQPGDVLPVAPLYTRYVKKADEYRIHVGLSHGAYNVIDIQQKRKRSGVEHNSQIRNAENGWVYCRENVAAPSAAVAAATASVRALGLEFGAVDIGWNRLRESPCVYEVNTAPGLEGSTVSRYASYLRGAIR